MPCQFQPGFPRLHWPEPGDVRAYVTLGTLFRRFEDLKPFDVGPEDMTYGDYFSAFHPKGARAFRVVMTDTTTDPNSFS